MGNKQRIAKAMKGHGYAEDTDVRALIEEQVKDILEYAALDDNSMISDDLLRYIVICLAGAIYQARATVAREMADAYLAVSA